MNANTPRDPRSSGDEIVRLRGRQGPCFAAATPPMAETAVFEAWGTSDERGA